MVPVPPVLASLPRSVAALLPPPLRSLRSATGFSLIKLYYGNRDLHYEVWLRPRLKTIEIGLHFESDELTNARLLGAFRARRRGVARALPAARIEPWDKGWARIWEPLSYDRLDGAFADELAERLASYVVTLEPMLRDALPADVRWDLPKARVVR